MAHLMYDRWKATVLARWDSPWEQGELVEIDIPVTRRQRLRWWWNDRARYALATPLWRLAGLITDLGAWVEG